MIIINRIKSRYLAILILAVLVVLSIILIASWLKSYRTLFPATKFTRQYKDKRMRSPTLFIDRNGRQLGLIGGSEDFRIQAVSADYHDLTTLSKILLAKEDRKLRGFDGIQHKGLWGTIEAAREVISWKGKLRAVFQTFGGNRQGASGLMEQLAGNLYGHDHQNPWFESGILGRLERKAVKTINAIRLAQLYQNPEQVVEDYVNLTYTAGMYHGINAFMLKRFDKPIDQVLVPIKLQQPYLSDEQIKIVTMLAYYVGQLTGPANYDPETAQSPIERYRIVKKAEFKKNLVLKQMREMGLLTETNFLKAIDQSLPFKEGEIATASYDPNIETLRRETIGRMPISPGGTIRTTVIKEVHDFINYELLKHRTLLSIKATKRYTPSEVPILKAIRPDLYGIYRVKVTKRVKNRIVVDLGVRMGERELIAPEMLDAISLQSMAPGKYISVGIDGFDGMGQPLVSLVQTDPLIKGAVILKSLFNGQVLAFGGGGYLNAAISPGSAFKPFLLKLAIDYGWQLENRLNNSCYLRYRLFSGPYYSPDNYGRCDESRTNFERYPDVKTVLKQSINKPVVYLLDHLTDQLPAPEFRVLADRFIKESGSEELKPVDFVYTVRENSVNFYLVTEGESKQFVGKITLTGQKNELIFERLKREKYLELNQSSRFLKAARVLDQEFEEFKRWHQVVHEVSQHYDALRKGLQEYRAGKLQDQAAMDSEAAVLDHFFYDDTGELQYDPYSQDKIVFINWELVNLFLTKHRLSGIGLGNFTMEDHKRYDQWVEDYQALSDHDFYREMIVFHPQFRSLLNLELFKAYLAELIGSEKSSIKGDFSLPLGTHRVSLVKVSEMYSWILTQNDKRPAVHNNQTYFIYPGQRGYENDDLATEHSNFVLNELSDVYQALRVARQEAGGTSSHLMSDAIVAGKTGTDPKYKTYVAVVMLNGNPYLMAAYFGVDLNKHESLVKAWTGGRTAAVYIDQVVSTIQNRYLSLFPKRFNQTIEFDADFEYDSTSDQTDDYKGLYGETPPESEQVTEPKAIGEPDGTYTLEGKDQLPVKSKAYEKVESAVDMDYSEEEIDQALQEQESD